MAGKRKPKNYVNNASLLEEIRISKNTQDTNPNKTPAECLTPKLINMLMMMVDGYGNKFNWRGYSYNDDMKGDALAGLMQNALKFDLKYDNPFGYYTQIIARCFLTYDSKEKQLRNVRDSIKEMSPDEDFKPSHARQNEEELDHLDYVKHSIVQPTMGRRKSS